jgi:hypothetical protein
MKMPALLIAILLCSALLISCGDDDDDDNDDSAPDDDDDNDTSDDDDDDNDDNDDNDDDDTAPLLALIPGPGEPEYDADLEAKAQRYLQQYHGISTIVHGFFLDSFFPDPANRTLIENWLTNSDPNEGFEEYTGTPVYDVVANYGQYGDTSAFGGPTMLGQTSLYRLTRDGKVKGFSTLTEQRTKLLKAMDFLHIMVEITGEPGSVARGIRPIDTPGSIPATTPLFDGYGNPLPVNKKITWRDDNSIGDQYPDWIWEDDESKDQLNGYLLGMAAIWDVIAEDPDIPANYKTRFQEDAAAIGDRLMEVAPETGLDLSIRDADGRLTKHHDINPRELEGVVLPEGLGNGFNALMALSMFKTIATITGEQRFEDFFYEMLVDRDYRKYVDQTNRFTYTGPFTNWSSVNMIYSAIYALFRFEADRELFTYWQEVMERDLWLSYFPGWDIGSGGQALPSLIYAAFGPGPTDIAAAEQAAFDLSGFPDPPYWSPETINCDDLEIETGQCLAIDGTTVLELAGAWVGGNFVPFIGHNDTLQTFDPVPRHLRPGSNYNWRHSPYKVNNDSSDRLNPGGDFIAVYWLGRYLKRSDDTMANTSPLAW